MSIKELKSFTLIVFWGSLLFMGVECQNNIGPKPNAPQPSPAPKLETKCGIENCSGLDIKCGPNIPEACIEVYQLGDLCRTFAKCEVINGECKFVSNEEFEKCKACAKKCEEDFKGDAEGAFACEEICRSKLNPL